MFAYCSNNPVMGYDPTGEFDIWGFGKGASRIVTGITAVVVGAAVCIAGAPVAMLVVASLTITTGVLTVVNGSADIQNSQSPVTTLLEIMFLVRIKLRMIFILQLWKKYQLKERQYVEFT